MFNTNVKQNEKNSIIIIINSLSPWFSYKWGGSSWNFKILKHKFWKYGVYLFLQKLIFYDKSITHLLHQLLPTNRQIKYSNISILKLLLIIIYFSSSKDKHYIFRITCLGSWSRFSFLSYQVLVCSTESLSFFHSTFLCTIDFQSLHLNFKKKERI